MEVITVPLGCPACSGAAMTPLVDGEIPLEIDFCPLCRGIWFDHEEIRQFIRSKKFKELFLDGKGKKRAPIGPLMTAGQKARSCPRCLKKMEQHTHREVLFDFCSSCQGIWLDDGEINQIVESFKQHHTGGEEMILQELRAGLKKEGFELSGLLNMIAGFFREFFEKLKKDRK